MESVKWTVGCLYSKRASLAGWNSVWLVNSMKGVTDCVVDVKSWIDWSLVSPTGLVFIVGETGKGICDEGDNGSLRIGEFRWKA